MTVMRTQISFRIERADLEKLRAVAVKDQLDLADILRRAVRELLQREKEAEMESGGTQVKP
jgi:hypothetical protein